MVYIKTIGGIDCCNRIRYNILHYLEHARGRPKTKIEDTSDQATPGTVHKKRATLESSE